MRGTWEIERRVEVEVVMATDRPTRVAVIADTHALPHREALGLVAAYAPDVVVHAGDIGDVEAGELGVLERFAAVTPQVIAVRGNIDGRGNNLPDAVTIRFKRGTAEVSRWLLVHIGVYGARLRAPVRALAARERADLLVCGHSHVPLITRDGPVAVFNPGSIGPRRFSLPIVFGTVSLADTGIRLGHVDCTTGQPWYP